MGRMTPEEDLDAVVAVAAALSAGDRGASDAAAATLARELTPRPKRASIPPSLALSVHIRDQWHCRYCGLRVVLPAALRLISMAYPQEFPYNRNWRWDSTHPVYNISGATVDHLHAYATEGNDLAPENLMTACWVCNTRKSNLSLEQLGWTLRPRQPSEWQGLTEFMWPMWEALGQPDVSPGIAEWMGLVPNSR